MRTTRFVRLAVTPLAVAAWAICGAWHAAAARAAPVWFVVAERPEARVHGDSFLLPIVDLEAIAHARSLIAGTIHEAPLVVAEIAAGADGLNRNVLVPGQPLWSWHVTQFEGFADTTIEILDGWPTFVEEDVPGWIENTRGSGQSGRIGFWNYAVVQEVAVPEPGAGLLAALGAAAVWAMHSATRLPASRRGRAV